MREERIHLSWRRMINVSAPNVARYRALVAFNLKTIPKTSLTSVWGGLDVKYRSGHVVWLRNRTAHAKVLHRLSKTVDYLRACT